MKRKLVPLSAVLFLIAAFEGHAFGLGIQAGGNWYQEEMYYDATLLISPYERLHFGLDWYLFTEDITFGAAVDYWVFPWELSSDGIGSTVFYCGLGGFLWAAMADDMIVDAGPRIPIGVDFVFNHLDVFLQVVPTYAIAMLPDFASGGFRITFNVGVRFWPSGRRAYRPLY